jgi:hypothetical protein
MRRTTRTCGIALAVASGLAAFAVPEIAWAPPLCHGIVYHREQLTLRVREATIDGVAVPLPSGSFAVSAGCPPDSVVGTLADPDPNVVDGVHQWTWVRKP